MGAALDMVSVAVMELNPGDKGMASSAGKIFRGKKRRRRFMGRKEQRDVPPELGWPSSEKGVDRHQCLRSSLETPAPSRCPCRSSSRPPSHSPFSCTIFLLLNLLLFLGAPFCAAKCTWSWDDIKAGRLPEDLKEDEFELDSFGTRPTIIHVPEGALFLPETSSSRSEPSTVEGNDLAVSPDQMEGMAGSSASTDRSKRTFDEGTAGGESLNRAKRVVVNYARECCWISQARNCMSALKHGADMCLAYNESVLSKEFKERNSAILSQQRGAGYWLWKPYVIWKTLMRLDPGDVVLYSDAAQDFWDDIRPICAAAMGNQSVALGWAQWFTNRKWTKMDAFLLMGCMNEVLCADAYQLQASLVAFRKSEEGLALVSKWLAYAQDPRVLTDMENTLGQQNYESETWHRHDQSILSLLAARHGLLATNAYHDSGFKWEFDCTVYHHRIRK